MLFWAGALLIGAVLVMPDPPDGNVLPPTDADAGRKPAEARRPPVPGPARHELRRSPDGHFYAEARVNGTPVRFLVDTGASLVALSATDAARAGIRPGDARAAAIAAGGEIEIAPVTIERIELGPLDARRIRGAVVKELPVSLLGQSFLREAGGVEIGGDRMVLR